MHGLAERHSQVAEGAPPYWAPTSATRCERAHEAGGHRAAAAGPSHAHKHPLEHTVRGLAWPEGPLVATGERAKEGDKEASGKGSSIVGEW